MSGISTGVGLISGINSAQLIDQLMAIESRPLATLRQRIGQIDARKTAFMELSAQLLAVKNAALRFKTAAFFQAFSAVSSRPTALSATAASGATPGTYTFRVHQLVSTAQVISSGFADAIQTPVGTGTLTIESARARVNSGTDLSVLNDGRGVRRGAIRITDRSGASAIVDLTFALNLQDVLDAINNATGVSVRARVTGIDADGASGQRLVIEDRSGGTTGDLIVEEVAGGFTAEDLGIKGRVSGDRLHGRELLTLSENTDLTLLNDGNGVGRFANGSLSDDLVFDVQGGGGRSFSVSLTDFLEGRTALAALNRGHGVRKGVVRVTTRDGRSGEIDLSDATTIQHVLDRINNAGLSVRAQIVQSRLLISDDSSAGTDTARFKVEDVTGHAAADLGILGETREGSISGRSIYSVRSLGDVLRAINTAPDNGGILRARTDGRGIILETTDPDAVITVRAGTRDGGVVSAAAADLGIEGAVISAGQAFRSRDLLGGLNTVLLTSLNGGAGVATGRTSFTNRRGDSVIVDLSSARTLQDVVDLLNRDLSGVAMRAEINPAGNGIRVVDDSGGAGPVVIADVDGTTARDLGLLANGDSGRAIEGGIVDGGNRQFRYISEGTLLSSFNQGRGVTFGEMRIGTADGRSITVSFSQNATLTVGHVLERINSVARQAGVNLVARINDNGDGLLIEDRTEGNAALAVSDISGTVARDLRLAQTASAGRKNIDGTFETRIDIVAGDTLTAVRDKINAASADVSASILHAGSGALPYSLILTSKTSGRTGDFVVDAGAIPLNLRTLVRAQDATVLFGGTDGAGVLVHSSTNSLKDVLPGVTIDLLEAGPDPVTLTVSQDMDRLLSAMRTFVDAVNTVQRSIQTKTKFDSETLARGILFSDSAVETVRARLSSLFLRRFQAGGDMFRGLSSIGLTLGTGGELRFDEERFRRAYAENPQQVEALFSDRNGGLGVVFEQAMEAMTGEKGTLSSRTELLDSQRDLLTKRITAMSNLLDAKRARLQRQFAGLESALAQLQRNQNALVQLQSLVSSAR